MNKSIFSTYHNAENRVTSTILAVLERLSNPTLSAIFQGIEGESNFKMITFENQYKNGNSIPDARIFASLDYIIETKIEKNAVYKDQLERHRNNSKEAKLIVLTPDESCPDCITELARETSGSKIIWCNFDILYEILHTVKEEVTMIPHEIFLLSELQVFFKEEGLLNANLNDEQKTAVIVPAREAWPFYKKYGIYRCQENRYFTPTKYMGFYAEQSIQPLFPEIIGSVESLILNDDAALDQAGVKTCMGKREEVIERLREFKKIYPNTDRLNDERCKYIVLAKKEDTSRFVSIKAPIKNDKKAYSGRNFAFVMKQAYILIDELQKATKTSELTLL